jgi:glycerol uptake facilitator-like aquaporin
MMEYLLSFALLAVIMGVATTERGANSIAPTAIGLTVGFRALVEDH